MVKGGKHCMNNKGFSLLELIIVMTIMMVLVSVVSVSMYAIGNNDVQSVATQTSGLISKCKVDSLSYSGDTYIIFKKEKDGMVAEYYKQNTLIETITLSTGNIIMEYTLNNGTVQNIETNPLVIAFNRTTGGFFDMKHANELIGNTSYGEDIFCTAITLSLGSKVSVIDIAPSTGGHKIQ